jgi:ABC-type Fe3+ transport system permease subunit
VGAITAVVAVSAQISIVRRVGVHLRIGLSTVLAALCIYLLIGLFFTMVYILVGAAGGTFFGLGHEARRTDYLYFSFVTLTTVGYGDLVPGTSLARMLAVAEALTGQLYLVSVVALLVGNLGRARQNQEERN